MLAIPEENYLIFKDGSDKENSESFSIILLNQASYAKADGKKIKFSFAGKIPPSVSDDESHKKYVRQLFVTAFRQKGINLCEDDLIIDSSPNSIKHGFAKDKIKIARFKNTIDAVSKCIFVKNKKRFISIGVCALSSNYLYGFNLDNLFKSVYLLGDMVKENFSEKSVDEFNWEYFQQRSKESMLVKLSMISSKAILHYAEIYAKFELEALSAYRLS